MLSVAVKGHNTNSARVQSQNMAIEKARQDVRTKTVAYSANKRKKSMGGGRWTYVN